MTIFDSTLADWGMKRKDLKAKRRIKETPALSPNPPFPLTRFRQGGDTTGEHRGRLFNEPFSDRSASGIYPLARNMGSPRFWTVLGIEPKIAKHGTKQRY